MFDIIFIVKKGDGVGLSVVFHKLKSGWWTTASVEADSDRGETEGRLSTYGETHKYGLHSTWEAFDSY